MHQTKAVHECTLHNTHMRSVIIGAGPSGLLFALLHKRRGPSNIVEVIEQNEAGSAFDFGVVFSQGALSFLERDAPDLYARLLPRMESWSIQRIAHRDTQIDIDGNGFSAIGRLQLNQFLQELCSESGVMLHFGKRIAIPQN